MCREVVTIKGTSIVVSAWYSLRALVYIYFRNESFTFLDFHAICSVSNCQSSLWNLVLKQLLGVTKVKHTWEVSPIVHRFIDKYKQFTYVTLKFLFSYLVPQFLLPQGKEHRVKWEAQQ